MRGNPFINITMSHKGAAVDIERVKLCNCAGCGCEMLGKKYWDYRKKQLAELEAAGMPKRITYARLVGPSGHDRPYCVGCFCRLVQQKEYEVVK